MDCKTRGVIQSVGDLEALTQLIEQYRGRVVDSPGDNLLAEFTSVVEAVICAVEIQRDLAERNADLAENRRMRFRIGINLGDVIAEGERIYGDGVNIAARMEGLAEAGGICISGTVYDAIESKIGLEYEFLGEQEVKNIDKPVRVYRVLSYPGAAAHRIVKAKRAERKKRWTLTFSAVTQNLETYFCLLKARNYFLRFNKDNNTLAQRTAKEAIALDPEYPYPYGTLGWTYFMDVWFGTTKSPKKSIAKAFESAQKGLALDPSLFNAHALLSYIYTFKKQYKKGIAEAEQTVEIIPNFADGYCHLARILHYVGRNMESLELYNKAMRINPFPRVSIIIKWATAIS
jgi:tetratricopeptide (TPR) repeat protein